MNYLILIFTILAVGSSNAAEMTCKQYAAQLETKEDRIEYMKLCDVKHKKPAESDSDTDGIVSKIAQDIAKFNTCIDSQEQKIKNGRALDRSAFSKGQLVEDGNTQHDSRIKTINSCADFAAQGK